MFGDLDNQPASTLLGVQSLVSPQFRIEVEATAVVSVQSSSNPTEFINPDTLPNYANSYSQAVVAKTGRTRTIYVAGQVALDKNGNLVGEGDLGAQADQAFKNLTAALEAAGAGTEDVVKTNVFLVGYDPGKTSQVAAAMGKYFPAENRPASTWVWVQSLARPQFLLEVEAVAVIAN